MSQSGPLVFTGGGGSNFLIQEVRATFNSKVTCNVTIPYDNTIPQNTEGTEVITCTITPTNINSILKIEYVAWGSSNDSIVTTALFQDANVNALVAAGVNPVGEDTLNLTYYMTAGKMAATTFKIRCGSSSGVAKPVYILSDSFNNSYYGGAIQGSLSITEFAN